MNDKEDFNFVISVFITCEIHYHIRFLTWIIFHYEVIGKRYPELLTRIGKALGPGRVERSQQEEGED